jgi:hypothetical protein
MTHMKTVLDHIEHVKGKPRHVRHRVAVGAATFASALIALVWLGVNLISGSFALSQESSFATNAGQDDTVTTSATSDGLAGAAAALPPSASASAPAHIEIVDTTPAPAHQKQSDQTILPF